MNDYRKRVEAAVEATVFHSPTTFSWFGKRSYHLPAAIRRALTPRTARNYLLFTLQSQLYGDFYCQGHAAPAEPRAASFSPGETPFVEALSAANCGSGYWEDGWEIRALRDEHVIVRRDQLELQAHLDACLVPRAGPLAPGMQLSLRFPKEFLRLSPGFYMALSDAPFVEEGAQPLVRFYWNLTAEAAVPFVRAVTLLLNEARLPFRLKVLQNPSQYTRCDAGVLYVYKSDYNSAVAILERIYPDVIGGLRQATPVFTKPLAPGVGLAEDPGPSESFGLQRCRLLADGMIRAYEQGAQSVAQRLRVVEDRYAEEGISLEAPFLNPGSNDTYIFRPRLERRVTPSPAGVPACSTTLDPAAFLRTAEQIGQHLSQQAVWHEDRCNWMGAEPAMHDSLDGQPGGRYRALGPDVYDGTSGVALFLAELHAATDDAAARRTALGAIRQALSRVDAVPPLVRMGFYTGWVGIAYAAVRVGILLDEEGLIDSALQLLRRAVSVHREQHELDLLSGVAGAIAGLVMLHSVVDDSSLMDFAVRLGDELVQNAEKSEVGYSWKSPGFPKQRHLTGFSHGAAGVGYALLELFQVIGDSKYRDAAERAFQYERSWFHTGAGNWPDFRGQPARGKRSKRTPAFATYWCHGAPGIALSRLRAYKTLNDETYRAEAIVALQTTRKALEQALHSEIGNFSLCHGLAGNAEVLHYGCQMLGQEWTDGTDLASKVACNGIKRYMTHPGLTWPCGTGSGETPGLMLGFAGIGHFYLRMYDPAIPSILIPQRK